MVINVDKWRKTYLAVAELSDAWRIIPRLLVAGYAYLVYMVISWYITLKPTIIDGCDITLLKQVCITEAPTTQHTSLVSVVMGVAAIVFTMYTNSGRKWNGFSNWNTTNNNTNKTKPQQTTIQTNS